MPTDRVVLLTTEGESGRVAARYLAARFPALTVIVETPVSRSLLLRRRIRRLGLVHVGGQLAFMLFQRIQQRLSKSRITEIIRKADLDARWPADREIIRVPSVNSPECIDHLRRLQPRAILVMGTRIIGAEVLRSVDAPFINYHAGVTPKYRGVHGGYWAKAQGDDDNFGVTIHLVDEGIDTGSVLHQARPATSAKDNYSSYPYLQLAAALPLLERSAREAIAGTLSPQRVDLPSRLWSHPTLWTYIQTGLWRGVW
jgi:folate-dependent phosphoribosylglycinamide formyltransferase PurN